MRNLTIYTVRPGDTLYTIAQRYGVTTDVLIYDNQISDPLRLVPGQALFIPVTSVSYTVRPGDSLYRIARSYGLTLGALLDANPTISATSILYPGQTVIVPFEDETLGSALVNGFATGSNAASISEALPYLTYLAPFSWGADMNGNLTPPANAGPLADLAAPSRAGRMLTVTNLPPEGGGFDSDIAHAILMDATAQNNLIADLRQALAQGGYAGVIFDLEYIYPYDRESYNQFLRRVTDILHQDGYLVMTCLAPKISDTQVGTLYEAHDYAAHGQIVDYIILMTYEWGYLYGPAMAVAPIDQVRRVLDYAVTRIPADKILLGMPNYGYDWTLPFVQGSAARVVNNVQAVEIAARYGAEIRFDERSQAPFFNYYDEQGRRHEVWFDDARSIRARLRLIAEYGLSGLSYWTIDNLFRAQYLVLSALYTIREAGGGAAEVFSVW
jgi:spore germination protein